MTIWRRPVRMPQVAKRATGTVRARAEVNVSQPRQRGNSAEEVGGISSVLQVVRRLKNCSEVRRQYESNFGEEEASLTIMVSSESVRFISQIDAPRVPRDRVATVMFAENQRKPESKRPA